MHFAAWRAACWESAAKVRACRLVLYGCPGRRPDSRAALLSLIDRAYCQAPFAVPFVLEAIGLQACSADGGGLALTLAGPDLPTSALILLHAGLGLATGRTVLRRGPGRAGTAPIERALARIAELAHPEYAAVATEALGLYLGSFRPRLLAPALARLQEVDRQAAGFTAHGAGRAFYFRPARLLPLPDSAWRALRQCRREIACPELALEAEKGVIFAFVFVNLHRPQVAEALLLRHGDEIERLEAWLPGSTAALLARAMTAPDDPGIERFLDHRPAATVAARWRRLIADPGRAWLAALRGPSQ